MIDLRIYDFLSTIAIGTAIIILLIYIYFISNKLFSKNLYKKDIYVLWIFNILKSDYSKSSHFLIILLLIFTFGLITQDLTDNLSDSEITLNPITVGIGKIELNQKKILHTEGELRLQSLLLEDSSLSNLGKVVFSNLKIREKVKNQLTKSPFPDSITNIENYWCTLGKNILENKQTRAILINYVNSIYYLSKNWCYLKSDPARKELNEIQLRIDLARSFTIISLLFSFIIIIFYTLYYFVELIKGKKRFRILVLGSDKVPHYESKVYNPVLFLILFVLIFSFSRICYSIAENNFNERAMGYYVDHFEYIHE
jgi:hypothetical protein